MCACVCERGCCDCAPVLFGGIHSVSPSICFYSHFPPCFKPSLCLWETTGTVFLGTRLCLSPSLPVISVPASSNCAIFQQELPLLSVAPSLKAFAGRGVELDLFLIP